MSPETMRDGICATIAGLGHAQRAGVTRNSSEMQQFAGNLFRMARTAGSYGLHKEAKKLFDVGLTLCLKPRWDYRVFGIATSVLGWETASRIAGVAKKVLVRSRDRKTLHLTGKGLVQEWWPESGRLTDAAGEKQADVTTPTNCDTRVTGPTTMN
jgi:hypothetical protein